MAHEGGNRKPTAIFINYRRGEHAHIVESVHRDLVRHFGEEAVFLDLTSIRGGTRYPDVIREHLETCDVLLAMIHPAWLTAEDAHGRRRIDLDEDWVRDEIATALRAGTVVIPVLLGSAEQPAAADLPASIRDLAHRQSLRLRHGSQDADVRSLVERLEQHVAPTWTPPAASSPPARRRARMPVRPAIALAAALLVMPSALMTAHGDPLDSANPPWTFVAAIYSMLLMTAPPIALAAVNLLRARINAAEREMHRTPAARYSVLFGTPVVGILVLSLIILTAVTSSEPATVVVAAILFVGVAGYAVSTLRTTRVDEEEDAGWPTVLPHPVTALALRRAVARVRTRLASWTGPPSRDRRDRAGWALAMLDDAARELRQQGEQQRLTWLTSKYPWQLCACLIWMAGTVGLVLASTTPRILTGGTAVALYATPAVATLFVAAMFAATVELAYRYRRWVRRQVADEALADLAALRAELEGR